MGAKQRAVDGGRPVPAGPDRGNVADAQAGHLTPDAPPEPLLLRNADLVTPDGVDDELPPPVYGETYGEIRDEKTGTGTAARVTDDGRVNIRINQFNHHLSQIFTPALRQHVETAQDALPLPPPYIPAALEGQGGVPPPPFLNVVIQVVGSRGDVQPFVALGKVLHDTYGHRVRLATHPHFRDFVLENGLEFFSIGGDPARLMAFMAKNPSLMPGFRSIMNGDIGERRKDVAEYIQGCWRSCYESGDGMHFASAADDDLDRRSEPETDASPFVADCIIANPPSFAHIHCAEKLGVPLHIMFTMPYSPTQSFAHPLANIQSSNADPQLTNFVSYAMIELLSWQCLGDIINRFRKKCLALDPISSMWAPGMLQRLRIPHTYCWSPALIPKPRDWGAHISVAGFYFLNLASNYTPGPELQAFLDAGPTPIYIGFGSIVLDDPNAMTKLILNAVRKTGQRVLLSQGWGGIGAIDVPDNVFMLGNVPHDWLFQHVSCVVHHGGAGTTAAGITAGRPTVVVPFFGDQPFWGAMLARAGAGPDPIPIRQLTADKLADAINFCLTPASRERAGELAVKIATERGIDSGAQSFHQHLDADGLRCSLAPYRAAVWHIKRTKIRLSAFAACTLANANLLDFRDLQLFRPREYYTDEGPLDPISGGFTAFARAFGGMAMGIADIPSETWKALQLPAGSNRQPQAAGAAVASASSSSPLPSSAPTVATKGKASRAQSQASLNMPPSSLGRSGRSASNLSNQSLSVSNSRSRSGPGADSSSSIERTASSQSRVHSRTDYGVGKNQDMLRPAGPHTSKGVGRFVRTLVQAPVEISVNWTKGFHNVPKLWGDDTVRPQERVTDFKTGMYAVGREFGYGWYDGVTGLVTQPWTGAREKGAGGFITGIGKGVGGFVAKPSAAFFGILGHTMKGVHKEVQKWFGSSVLNYIIDSRAAQGYEEWLQSSEAEIEDVIARWKQLQKDLPKKGDPNEKVREDWKGPHKMEQKGTGEGDHSSAYTAGVAAPAYGAGSTTATDASHQRSSGPADNVFIQSLSAAELNGTIRQSAQEYSGRTAERKVDVERAVRKDDSELHRQREGIADTQKNRSTWRQAVSAGKSISDSELGSASETDIDEPHRWTRATSGKSMDKMPAAGRGYGTVHLGGTTQQEFEASQARHPSEKTMQEKTEEEVVMEYVKKQSLLEAQHFRGNGKGRASVLTADDDDDAELQEALKLSMQGR
ncbi:glycosyltransferase family 1 protein [Zasmidium cellare ATCC 36951]|uniref:Glycosyltransferase family 1 protein n=1 Tax=Zasmidium cellare ATCC 36951 TaxID=1080233 RepID=A0A6A6BUF5_ZASCE|nr:glycosyltransferase family 1 protein [Zasmidium cellare ATCC 36951]KAF2158434.1 glycosyltransferase family 1 protein [Zasmidium cellare ATCC 36951]